MKRRQWNTDMKKKREAKVVDQVRKWLVMESKSNNTINAVKEKSSDAYQKAGSFRSFIIHSTANFE